MDLGRVISSPAGSGAEPRPKIDFMHISGQKEAILNTLSVLLSDGGAPNITGPGKTPPLDGPAQGV